MIKSIVPYGASYRTRTAEMSTLLPSNTPALYFLKMSHGDNGRNMTARKYTSM